MKYLLPALAGLLALEPLASPAQSRPYRSPYDSARFGPWQPVPRARLRPLRPDRPGITESPYTVDAGHLQVEADLLRLRREPDSDAELAQRTWYGGNAIVKLGLSRRTDVQAEVPLYVAQQQRLPAADTWQTQHGVGDVGLRLKHNFVGDDQQGPLAASLIGYVRLPVGAAGVSHDHPEYGLVLPVNVELGDTYNLEAQLETEWLYDPEQGQRYTQWQPSVALDRQFGQKLGLLVEGAFPWDTAQHQWQAQLNLAPTFNVTDNVQLDLGTHLALNGHTSRAYFVGLTVRR